MSTDAQPPFTQATVSKVWLDQQLRELHLLRQVAAKASAFLIAPYLGEHQQPLGEALLAWQQFRHGTQHD